MRLSLRIFVVLLVLIAGGFAIRPAVMRYLQRRAQPKFELHTVTQGPLRETVSATGRVEPRLRVPIGAFVSGPIVELNVDFNEEVKKGKILAKIDPALYEAALQRDEASLMISKAEVLRVEAQLDLARRDEERGLALYAESRDYITQAELDQLKFNRRSLEAQQTLAESAVLQSEANLANSRANLGYTEIKAPQDGTVIDRKIDPGQTLAAQFQTPELFVLGVDMEKEMYIYASVDEMDIGRIRTAQAEDQPVRFRVDAYPDELFEGKIKEIRLSSTETQNVVTYPVVVTAANPDRKLLPGMTANLTFQIQERSEVVLIPWAALRFFPRPELVREEDRVLLEGGRSRDEDDEVSADVTAQPTVEELSDARKQQRRHVWVRDGEKLKAVEVRLGISDYKHAELLEGEVKPGDELVLGIVNERR